MSKISYGRVMLKKRVSLGGESFVVYQGMIVKIGSKVSNNCGTTYFCLLEEAGEEERFLKLYGDEITEIATGGLNLKQVSDHNHLLRRENQRVEAFVLNNLSGGSDFNIKLL